VIVRLFQIGHLYPAQSAALSPSLARCSGHAEALDRLVAEVPKSHLLQPCLEGREDAFLSFVAEETSLRLWASEQGMPPGSGPEEIVLAQIEHHRAEVLYCVHGSALSGGFFDTLPGNVRCTVAWLGSPLVGDAYRRFDVVVSNFPSINRDHAAQGLNTAWFFPSYDPTVEDLPAVERDLDVVFVGGYTRHHGGRAELLEQLARAADDFHLSLHLDNSRYTPLADTWLGLFPPLSAVRRPRAIRRVARPALFGREMFARLARGRIVVNMAIDMAGTDRGNMRCFEALSAGALLVSDEGEYPEGFVPGETFVAYDGTPEDALERIRFFLADEEARSRIAAAGRRMVRERYGKDRQWRAFQRLVEGISLDDQGRG